jgi:hypothetical protein
MQRNQLIALASADDLKRGYLFDPTQDKFSCLGCGFKTEPGQIYRAADAYYDAEKFMRIHIESEHGSPLQILLQLDKRWTGLTELQTQLIGLFAGGVSDQAIAGQIGADSVSTIRNHRFLLREKLKQAKCFLAIGELMEDRAQIKTAHPTAKSAVSVSAAEQKILATYFPQGEDGPLTTYPGREKRRLIVLRQLAERFSPNRSYTEKEVNAILSAAYEDHVLLRRQLIDYGFLSRRPDGSEYRRCDAAATTHQNTEEDEVMDPERKKVLLREYKETPLPMGIFQIKNNATGKLLLLKALNLPGIINRHQLELRRGMHRNRQLQQDWNQYGETAFSFDILATLKPEEYLPEYYPTAVNDLFDAWLEKLQPFGDAGYNKPQ